MNHWGKITGAVIGYFVSGPKGILVGILLGFVCEKLVQSLHKPNPTRLGPGDFERLKPEFFIATFTVMGHLSRSAGLHQQEEFSLLSRVMDRMNVPEDRRKEAMNLFNEGKQPNFLLLNMVSELYKACRDQPRLLQLFVELQIYSVYIYGFLSQAQKQILINICYQLDMTRVDFDRFQSMVRSEFNFNDSVHRNANREEATSLVEAYAVLNADPNASDEEIKQAYRRLRSKHHPDKIMSKGLSEDVLKIAEDKTREIRDAYERIRSVRDF